MAKKRKIDEASLTPEELERREKQRKAREAALAKRAQVSARRAFPLDPVRASAPLPRPACRYLPAPVGPRGPFDLVPHSARPRAPEPAPPLLREAPHNRPTCHPHAQGEDYVASQKQRKKARSLDRLRKREEEAEAKRVAKGLKPRAEMRGDGHREKRGARSGAPDGPPRGRAGGDKGPQKDVQVVVIPLYWKKQEEGAQKRQVLTASRVASEHLRSRGYAAWVDMDEAAMPGARMRKWEEAGVKCRVEIGPRDVEADPLDPGCVVALVRGVGEVADKHKCKVGDATFFARVEEGAGRPKLAPREINLPTEVPEGRRARGGDAAGGGKPSFAGTRKTFGAEDEDDFGL